MPKAIALCGGGARGIFQAHNLAKVEARIAPKTLVESVDMIAGTSVGALVAVLLAHGMTAHQAAITLESLVPAIFAKPWKSRLLSRHYYPRDVLLAEGHRLAPKLCGALETRLLIHAYEENAEHPVTFDTRDPNLASVPAIDLAIASAAAPTYFGPYVVPRLDRAYSDGGTTANNPSRRAMQAGATEVVSFGTGRKTRLYDNRQVMSWRFIRQALRLVPQAMDNAELIEAEVAADLGDNFVHIDADLRHGVKDEMDNASPEQIENLRRLSDEAEKADPGQFDRAADLLLATSHDP